MLLKLTNMKQAKSGNLYSLLGNLTETTILGLSLYPNQTCEAFEDARMKFDVRYYLVAILFILFDLETAFLFPWGVALRDIGWEGYVSMVVFLFVFIVGFVYIWKKGALDWE